MHITNLNRFCSIFERLLEWAEYKGLCIHLRICLSLRRAILHPLKIGPCIHTTWPSMLRKKKFFFFYFVHGGSIKDMPTHSDWRESTCSRLRNLLQPPISLSGERTHHTASAHSRKKKPKCTHTLLWKWTSCRAKSTNMQIQSRLCTQA